MSQALYREEGRGDGEPRSGMQRLCFYTDNSYMVFIGAIFSYTYHTKQLNIWPNSLVSRVANYSWLSACPGKMEPFKDNPSIYKGLTNFRSKPQLKQAGHLSAPIRIWIVSYCVQLLFGGKSMSCCCVCGSQLFLNSVTYSNYSWYC